MTSSGKKKTGGGTEGHILPLHMAQPATQRAGSQLRKMDDEDHPEASVPKSGSTPPLQKADSLKQFTEEFNKTYSSIEGRLREIENANQFSWLFWVLAILLPSILALIILCTTVHLEWGHGESNRGIASANQEIQFIKESYVTNDGFQKAILEVHLAVDKVQQPLQDIAAAQAQLNTEAERLNRDVGVLEGKSVSLLTDVLNYKLHVTKDIEEIKGRLNLNEVLAASQKEVDQLQLRLSDMGRKIHESEEAMASLNMAKEATSSIKKQMGLLTAKVAETSSTAQTALSKADAGLSALEGVAFVKSRVHDCPPGTVICTLWHWYKPDPFDPWCGGMAQQFDTTVDMADGRCFQDAASSWKNLILGCCRV